jgi:redox-sensitive bicupin YhaK (pirin superfamily)
LNGFGKCSVRGSARFILSGFIYVLEGEGTFGCNDTAGAQGEVLWLGFADGHEKSEVKIAAQEKLRALLYAGEPLHEPVVARGPFVMNTEEQIRQAYQDFREGKFI